MKTNVVNDLCAEFVSGKHTNGTLAGQRSVKVHHLRYFILVENIHGDDRKHHCKAERPDRVEGTLGENLTFEGARVTREPQCDEYVAAIAAEEEENGEGQEDTTGDFIVAASETEKRPQQCCKREQTVHHHETKGPHEEGGAAPGRG